MKINILLILILFICICDLPQDPGSMPTEIIATEFASGHNIMGILRADDSGHRSYIRVERAYEVEEIYDSLNTVVYGATVILSTDSTSWEFSFSSDSLYGDVYINNDFSPIPGQRYDLLVQSPGLPDLTAVTTVPNQPQVFADSITVTSSEIIISLPADSSIIMHDIYINSMDDAISQRIITNRRARRVSIPLAELIGILQNVTIFGYEKNLSTYLTSPTTIKPQTYSESANTVEGGYGCFGAVSVTGIALD